MEVSIIIVSYNTCDILRDCIKSVLKKATGIDYEIIVTDNASTDGSVDMLRVEFPEITTIASTENLGFGRANNLALQQARGKFILFLNPDTILRNNAVKTLSKYLNDNPNTGICGGNLFDADGNPALSFQRAHTIWTEFVAWMPNSLNLHNNNPANWFNKTGKPRQVECISGADMMIRRDVIEQCGGAFDPDFFMYYEDMELSMRVARNGWSVVSVPEAEITHLAGQSCTISDRKLEMLLDAKYIFYTKTHGKFYTASVYHLIQTLYKAYALLYAVTGKSEKRKRYDFWSVINKRVWVKFRNCQDFSVRQL